MEMGGALRAVTGGFFSGLLAHTQNLSLRSKRLRRLPIGPFSVLSLASRKTTQQKASCGSGITH